jgi:hypothetical protein
MEIDLAIKQAAGFQIAKSGNGKAEGLTIAIFCRVARFVVLLTRLVPYGAARGSDRLIAVGLMPP